MVYLMSLGVDEKSDTDDEKHITLFFNLLRQTKKGYAFTSLSIYIYIYTIYNGNLS